MTSLPNVTSPDTVKWSSSRTSGMLANLDKKSFTCRKDGNASLCKTNRILLYTTFFYGQGFSVSDLMELGVLLNVETLKSHTNKNNRSG